MAHIREVEREAKYFEFTNYCICKNCADNMTEEERFNILYLIEESEGDCIVTQERIHLRPNMFPKGLRCNHCNEQILEPIRKEHNK